MKRTVPLIFISACQFFGVSVFGQGALTPPGAPNPTMKSLDQIEARTPISSLPFTISNSGSYYLTKNVSVSSGDAISINASSVTLDLNGFTISTTASSANGTAILINGALQNILIVNGSIRGGVTETGGSYSGSGFANGITCIPASPPTNVRASGVSVAGCLADGINLSSSSGGAGTIAESCVVHTVGGFGIFANVVKNCSAMECGQVAIAGLVVSGSIGETVSTSAYDGINTYTAENCYGFSIGGTGVTAVRAATNCYGSTQQGTYGLSAPVVSNSYGENFGAHVGVYTHAAQNCSATSESGTALSTDVDGMAVNCTAATFSGSGTAIYADSGSTILNCVTSTNASGSLTGIYATSNCLIQGNSVDGASKGIWIVGNQNRIDSNRVIAFLNPQGQAFIVDGSDNLMTRNSARSNGINQYQLNGAANSYGTIVNVSAGGQLPTTDPWANFIY